MHGLWPHIRAGAVGGLGSGLLVLVPVGCDHDGTLGEDEPEPIEVLLLPAQLSYREGDLVVANVRIMKAENVGSVPFHLHYDGNVLRFLPPAIEGPFMIALGRTREFSINANVLRIQCRGDTLLNLTARNTP